MQKNALFLRLSIWIVWNVTYVFMVYCLSYLLQVRAVMFCYREICSFFFLKNRKKFVKQSHDDIPTTIIYFKGPWIKLRSQSLTEIFFHRIYYFNTPLQQSTIHNAIHVSTKPLNSCFQNCSYSISLTATTIITPVLITATSFWWSNYLQPTITTL